MQTVNALLIVLAIALSACGNLTPIPTPSPNPTTVPIVRVTLKSNILDKVTRQPVKGLVKVDGKTIFENVNYFEVVMPADTRAKPVYVRVEAKGYNAWEQGYRHYWMTSKVYEFPVELERGGGD
jgi:hypothetical protein